MAGETTSLTRDFADLLCAFIDHEVRFLVVGAYALAAHGLPRATGDLDVWIEPTPENAGRAMRALRAFGAPTAQLTETELATPGVILEIGLPPIRIDILTTISGVSFAEAWPARLIARFDEIEVPALGREHLILDKRATGRPKDLIDLRVLERSPRG